MNKAQIEAAGQHLQARLARGEVGIYPSTAEAFESARAVGVVGMLGAWHASRIVGAMRQAELAYWLAEVSGR